MQYNDRIVVGNASFNWIEIASLPDYSINGELYFAKALKDLYDVDQYIDVGGAVIGACGQSPLQIMDCSSVVIDTHGLPPETDKIRTINGLVSPDHHQLDNIINGRNIFIKVDVDGNDLSVIKTLSTGLSYGDVDPHVLALQFEYDFHWEDKGITLNEAYEHLPYEHLYAIEHNGLKKIDYPLVQGDFNYRNIVCGNFDADQVTQQMQKYSLINATTIDQPTESQLKMVDKVRWWHNNELRKGNTAKRRKNIYPHDTFGS